MDNNKKGDIFKKCSCGSEWYSLEEFISDKNLTLVGYQANFNEIDLGIILFNHKNCGSTIGVKAYKFKEFRKGPIFRIRLTGKDICPGYCFCSEKLTPCSNPCECSWVRDVIEIINIKKGGKAPTNYIENSIYVQKFEIPSFGIDYKGKLKITYLMYLLQEMAGIHARIFHYSYEDLIKRGFTWVLSRYKLRLYSLPIWKDEILIYTWNSKIDEKFAIRDYEVITEEGILVALASSSWALLDLESRKVVDPRKIIPTKTIIRKTTFSDGFTNIANIDHYKYEREFLTSLHDVDLNRHVNNVVYIDWLLRSLPDNFLRKYKLLELEIDYKREVRAGENIFVRSKILENVSLINVIHLILNKNRLVELARARTIWKYITN